MTAMWEAAPSQDDIEAEWMRLPSFVRNKWGAVITNLVWMARQQERAAAMSRPS